MSTLNRDKIITAIETINKDDSGFYHSGKLQTFDGRLTLFKYKYNDRRFVQYEDHLRLITYDLRDIERIAYKLDFFKYLWGSGGLTDGEWRMFAASDIDLFHFSIRSVFDSAARLIVEASGGPGQAPKTFTKLRNWLLNNPDRQTRFGEDLAEVIISCEWFEPLRDIRDDIVHESAEILTFQEPGKILFMLLPPHNTHHFITEVMFNENVVDFELYAGLYFGYLIAFLEEISSIIMERLELEDEEVPTRILHSGLGILSDWMNRLIRG
jgi:hypothetical protein